MFPFLRALRLLPLGLWSVALGSTGSAAATEEVLPEMDLAEISLWSLTSSASVSAGYRDNVLLSSTGKDGSPLLRGELEVMALRLPEETWDGFLFFSALENRFLAAEETDHERTVLLAGQARWQPVAPWQATFAARGYHHDQVFDVSVTEAELRTAPLKMEGFVAGPTLRWIAGPLWVEAAGHYRRDRYHDDVDGYAESEGAARIGYTWAKNTEVSVGGAQRQRDHDDRPQFTLGGRPISGSRLSFQQTEANAKFAWTPSESEWSFGAGLLREENRDSGTGYFDYDRDEANATVTWRGERLTLRLYSSVARYVFPRQLEGAGLEPEMRHKDEWRGTVEATWKLTERWALLGVWDTERTRSNDPRSQFSVNTGYLGVRWEWDNLAQMINP
jgi:hypothetical protein